MKKYKSISVSIKDLVENYSESETTGIRGYDGKLNIRPAYQREFVYKNDQRDAVIETINDDMFLNVFWWALNKDGTYELLDGQQRTISICQYVNSKYSIEGRYFHNLTDDEQEKLLSYEIEVKIFEGTDSEKLAWFKRINIAGEQLTNQELRNAVYTGTWLESAKQYFSKPGCPAFKIASKYLSGSAIRQDYLEEALNWISVNKPEDYMAKHQNDKDAKELWDYFNKVITWINTNFTVYRKEMKGLDWGGLYRLYSKNSYLPADLENDINKLMADDDVTKKSGVYKYVLDPSREEKVLNIRAFTDTQKRTAYEKQNGICPVCGKKCEFEEMQGDHIIPWSKGGKTVQENCQMLCKDCNNKKSNN